jgi:multidrug efflux pump subunit AcrB
VARIVVGGSDRERAYFVGDNPAVSIRVDRSEDGDAIAIQRQVEGVAAELESRLPEGTSIDLIRTRAEAISGRLNILLDNALLGLALVVGLLFLFLNARTAFWVAAGIPVALIAAIALMYAAGLTLNMISLFALIITLGIVVDDAIVVGEHADYRYRTLGEDPVTAAENAASRMAAPVFSATITTVLAFAGLVFVGGRFGTLIADIPFTVIVVLLASLVECFLILPNHMAHALAHSAKEHWYDMPSRVVNRGFEWVRERGFRPLMGWVIWARYPVLAAMILVLATQVALFLRGDVTWRFFNAPEISSVSGNFAMLDGATREDSIEMVREMQRAVDAVAARLEEEHGRNPVAYVVAEIGGNTGGGLSGADSKDADLLGSIAIELIDADLRPYSSFAFVAQLQEEVRQLPLTETLSFRGWRGGPGGDAIDVQIYGADTATLKAAAEAVTTALAVNPEVSGLEDSMAYDREELSLELTPQGEALGFAIDDLGRVLRNRLGGIEAATFPDGPRTASIRVEVPQGELTADFLDRTLLRAGSGEYVPLADIVTVTARQGFSTIDRENGVRLISVTGDLSEDDPVRAEEVMETLREVILPQVETDFGVDHAAFGSRRAGTRLPQRCLDRVPAVHPGHLPRAGLDLRQLDAAHRGHGDHPLRPCRHDLRSPRLGRAAIHVHRRGPDRDDGDHHQRFHRPGDHHRRKGRDARPDPGDHRRGVRQAQARASDHGNHGPRSCAAALRGVGRRAVPQTHGDHARLRFGLRHGDRAVGRARDPRHAAGFRKAGPRAAAGRDRVRSPWPGHAAGRAGGPDRGAFRGDGRGAPGHRANAGAAGLNRGWRIDGGDRPLHRGIGACLCRRVAG